MEPTLNERAYQHIRQRLVEGKLAAGQRLVTRNLAEEIGVSLAPIREALHRLATEGLVIHQPGAGAFVRQPNRQDLEELYVLRDAIESCAAAEAAKYASPEQLDEMDEIVGRWSEIAAEVSSCGKATQGLLDRWLDNEEGFHLILVEASRNRLLTKIIQDHRAIATVFEAQRHNPKLLTPEVCQETCQARRELMQALRNREAETARQLMSQQINRGKKVVLGFLRRSRNSH